MQIGSRVRAKRKALGLTQNELAHELSVTHQHISRVEGGLVVPSMELVVGLSRKLGVTTDYLLTGRETAPLDATGAIRAEPGLSRTAKRHLIGVLDELRGGSSAD
jgi:transcriptional regulator with XRE-family HTH domain